MRTYVPEPAPPNTGMLTDWGLSSLGELAGASVTVQPRGEPTLWAAVQVTVTS